jgi:hypothetical protein
MSLEDVSRSLARRGESVSRTPDGLVLTEPLADVISRSLASPIRRRRAIGIVSGTLLAAAAWRPRPARAATCTGDEHKCTEGGREICAPNPNTCCNVPNCAAAYCRYPWAQCGSGSACNDTPQMCTVYHYNGPNRLKFCSKQVAINDSCRNTTGTAGWCCHTSMTCGVDIGDCVCLPPGTGCGDQCCKGKQYCDTSLFGEDVCVDRCFDGREKCNGYCCTHSEHCLLGIGCTCNSGYSAEGTNCVKDRDDPGDPPTNPLQRMLNMMQQTSASHGGGSSTRARPRGIQPRGAAVPFAPPAGVNAAVAALAAVNAQGAAAMLSIRFGKRDPNFRSKVKVKRVTPPKLVAGNGLDVNSAAALNKLLAAQAKANSLVAAMSTALWRSRAARRRHNQAAAKRQLRAAIAFGNQAVRAFQKLQTLRDAASSALEAGQVAEVVVGADGVAGFKATGIPADLRPALAKLGVTSADIKRLRSFAKTVPDVGGNCLIEPVRAGQDTLITGLLSTWTTQARFHPLAV